MEGVIDILIRRKYINHMDVIHLQMTNKSTYMFLYERVNVLYKNYIQSDAYKERVVKTLNHSSLMIDAFVYTNNKLLTNMLFDFIIMCYENWHWLTMNDHYRNKLKLPQAPHFKAFLKERGITIHDILPNVQVTYTHFHRPSKSFSYYKNIGFRRVYP